jgi:hypothetical protein
VTDRPDIPRDTHDRLPENVQTAAIAELRERLAKLAQRRVALADGFQALQDRVMQYTANHPNL